MKLLKYIVWLIMVGVSIGATAQPVIKFTHQRYDFGTIEEALGEVTCNFDFENTGDEPLVISRVRTSCGCTVPEYTEEPIAPGEKGSVKITFNPSGRPGKFSKSIYVYTNTDPDRTILRILGTVVRPEDGTPVTQYAYRMGDLGLSALHLSLSTIVKGRPANGQIDVVNVGNDTLIPRAVDVPAHITVDFEPDTLLHNERGKMTVTYNPDAIDDWGYRRDEFHLDNIVSDATPTDDARYNTITVSGVLQEDFASYSVEQREQAPILVVGRDVVDFKVVKGTEKVQREIYVVNAGFTPLVIHKVRCDNSVINVQLKKNVLKPGQSTKMSIEVDPMRARSNTMLTDIFIVSNDPTNPQQSVRVTVEFQ